MTACLRFALAAVLLLDAEPSVAQYSEVPRPLPSAAHDIFGAQEIRAAAQVAGRLFLGGSFTQLAPPVGGAAVVGPSGALVPGGFPYFTGDVSEIVNDGVGGWVAVGAFTSVDGIPMPGFVRLTPDRRVDPRFRVVAPPGSISHVAVAHGRIYIAGSFRSINGEPRGGLAALSASTGALTAWARGFDTGGRFVRALSASSTAVYVSAPFSATSLPPRLWGLDASSGELLFGRSVTVTAIAASSTRVYLGGVGFARPVWAVDPITGNDSDWSVAYRFLRLDSTTGEYTSIYTMLLDGGRLYFGGALRTDDGRVGLAAADAATGARAAWNPQTGVSFVADIRRIGPAITVVGTGSEFRAFDASTAALLPFPLSLRGEVRTVAAAPEGLVLGGALTRTDGVPRAGLASIDLDTFQVEPWTSSLTMPTFGGVSELAAGGGALIVRTFDGRVSKVDPATGAVLAERTFFGAFGLPMRVKGGEIFVAFPVGGGFDVTGWNIGIISIADWSYRVLPVDVQRFQVSSLDVDGDTVYLAGSFETLNGASRRFMGAVSRSTGAVLPWRPAPDVSAPLAVRAEGGRVWVAGGFRRIGGAWRRGLAELDPVTGAALPWNPDLPGLSEANGMLLEVGPDGHLYVGRDSYSVPTGMTAGSQRAPGIVAYSTATGRRLPWRHGESGAVAVLSGCVVAKNGCLSRTIAPPTATRVAQIGNGIILEWTLDAAPARTGVRLEVGSAEGASDLYAEDLPASQTTLSSPAPPGRYFARVRSLAGSSVSPPSDDVSFAVGSGVPAAALDVTAAVERTRLTFAWRPPSTGSPQAYVLEAGSSEGKRDLAVVPIAGDATSFVVEAPPGRYWARLFAVNGTTRSAPGTELRIVMAPEDTCPGVPYAPEGLTATVSGNAVTLSWRSSSLFGLPPDGYRILVGSTPGQRNLGTIDAGPALTLSGPAPAGTYYVSVVAVGLCGESPLSNVVAVVVP